VRHDADGFGHHVLGAQPVDVRAAVIAERGHHDRRSSQRLQVVGDVAGGAAPLAAHLSDLKSH